MKLDDYIEEIAIREVVARPETYVTSEESDIAIRRVSEFLPEEEGRNRLVPPDRNDARRLLRALLNDRPPGGLPVVKAGFDPNRICTPQGDCGYFQCSRPCSNDLYPNQEIVESLSASMAPGSFAIGSEDIPRCPHAEIQNFSGSRQL